MQSTQTPLDLLGDLVRSNVGSTVFVGEAGTEYLKHFDSVTSDHFALIPTVVGQGPFRTHNIVAEANLQPPRSWWGAFPLVVACNLFSQEPSPDLRRRLGRILVRLMAPGALLAFSTFDFGSGVALGPKLPYGYHSLGLDLKMAGLTEDKIFIDQHIITYRRANQLLPMVS